MNDVTVVLGVGYQGFCGDCSEALVLKSVTIREGYNFIFVTSYMDDTLENVH